MKVFIYLEPDITLPKLDYFPGALASRHGL